MVVGKVFGAGMILGAALLCGIGLYREEKQRCSQLGTAVSFAAFAKKQIGSYRLAKKDILANFPEASSPIFAAAMTEQDTAAISLRPAEMESFSTFVRDLGSADSRTELKRCDEYENLVSTQYETAKAELPKQKKMKIVLTVLVGIGVILLLW